MPTEETRQNMWSSWLIPPPANAPAQPPPAGLDVEEELMQDSRVSTTPKQVPVLKPPRRDRSKEFIDRDLIERVLKDDNGLELAWLQELLEDGVRVLNNTGRYIKSAPFLTQIRKQRKAKV